MKDKLAGMCHTGFIARTRDIRPIVFSRGALIGFNCFTQLRPFRFIVHYFEVVKAEFRTCMWSLLTVQELEYF